MKYLEKIFAFLRYLSRPQTRQRIEQVERDFLDVTRELRELRHSLETTAHEARKATKEPNNEDD